MTTAVWAIAVMMNGAAPISIPFQLPESVKAGLAAAFRPAKITSATRIGHAYLRVMIRLIGGPRPYRSSLSGARTWRR
jgi:hypothetical protein